METQYKEELITQTEFARRLGVSPSYIGSLRLTRLKPAMRKGKVKYVAACKLLNRDPVTPNIETKEKYLQDQVVKKKREKFVKVPIVIKKEVKDFDDFLNEDNEDDTPIFNPETNGKTLLEQIEAAVKNPKHKLRYEELSSLENKAKILKIFYSAEKEKLAYEKELGNLFTRDSLERILTFAINSVRNAMLNLPNNYAVNLEGLNKKEIKEYVEKDINKILEDLLNIESQFDGGPVE